MPEELRRTWKASHVQLRSQMMSEELPREDYKEGHREDQSEPARGTPRSPISVQATDALRVRGVCSRSFRKSSPSSASGLTVNRSSPLTSVTCRIAGPPSPALVLKLEYCWTAVYATSHSVAVAPSRRPVRNKTIRPSLVVTSSRRGATGLFPRTRPTNNSCS